MTSLIKHPKDFWAGLIYVGLGAAAIWFVRTLPMGKAMRMGPAYFPCVLGGLLILLGLASLCRSLIIPGAALERFAWCELFLIVIAVVLFGLLLEGAGFVIASSVLVLTGAYAGKLFRWRTAILLAAGLTIISALVFVTLLSVPLPLLGRWFGQ